MSDEQPEQSGLAAMDPKNFGVVSTQQALSTREKPKVDVSKFKDLMSSIHSMAFSQGNVDDQTHLEWENLEGEVIGEVLQYSMLGGTQLLQIEDDLFNFATVDQCINAVFEKSLVEAYKKRLYVLPSVAVMKENLNRLMISYQRQGRKELVEMLKGIGLSLSEQERTDPTQNKKLFR
jgi:hypothetical protein